MIDIVINQTTIDTITLAVKLVGVMLLTAGFGSLGCMCIREKDNLLKMLGIACFMASVGFAIIFLTVSGVITVSII